MNMNKKTLAGLSSLYKLDLCTCRSSKLYFGIDYFIETERRAENCYSEEEKDESREKLEK